MDNDKDKKTTASDILFQNVYQVSEDMLQATYKLVEELSKFEGIFHSMTKKLDWINNNLRKHVVGHKWVKGADKKRCQEKISQSKVLMSVCEEYAKSCRITSDNLIDITEHFESNKKVCNIIKNLVDKIEGEAKKIEDEKGKTGTCNDDDNSNDGASD